MTLKKKYPVDKARGVSTKYDKLQEKGDWMAKYSIVELSINKGNLIGIDNLNNNEKTALELKNAIYIYRGTKSKKIYIGQTIHFIDRHKQHYNGTEEKI